MSLMTATPVEPPPSGSSSSRRFPARRHGARRRIDIGSGIFHRLGIHHPRGALPGLLLLVWILSGVVTLLARSPTASCGDVPQGGGNYVISAKASRPCSAFSTMDALHGHPDLCTIAAVAIAFARFTAVLFPALSDTIFLAARWAVTTSACPGNGYSPLRRSSF